jgi:hypothetical protein
MIIVAMSEAQGTMNFGGHPEALWNALIGVGNASNGDADKRMAIQFDHE